MLKIKLSRYGRRNDPKYRVVIAEAKSPRDGKYVDNIGFYDPIANPPLLKINQKKLTEWMAKGAMPTKGFYRLYKSKLATFI